MKTFLTKTLKTTVLSLALFSGNLQAQGTLDQSNLSPNNGAMAIQDAIPSGQSFVAGTSGSLVRVSAQLQVNTCTQLTSCGFIAQIYSNNCNGSLLATQNFSVPTGTSGMCDIIFTSPANISAGSSYFINIMLQSNQICESGPMSMPPFVSWMGADGFASQGTYTAGMFYGNMGGNPCQPYTAADVVFETYVAPPVSGNTTKLKDAQCNTTLTVLDGSVRLYCDKVTNATNYIWQFTDVATNTVVFTKARMAQWTDFYLTGYWPAIKYNKTYSVKVKAQVNGVWGDYGTACTITTPATPSASVAVTKLTSAFCDQTLSSLNSTTKIYCNSVQGATDYEWQFSNPTTGAILFTKRRLAQWTDFYLKGYWPTVQLNTTYNVKIRVYVNDQWSSFGPTCTLTTPSQFSKETYTDAQIARLLMGESEEAIDMENQLNLINVYPNPAKDVLNIESPIEVKNIIITNLAGQKVAEYSNTNSINIANLVNGIYFINVSTNEGSKNLKVIKD